MCALTLSQDTVDLCAFFVRSLCLIGKMRIYSFLSVHITYSISKTMNIYLSNLMLNTYTSEDIGTSNMLRLSLAIFRVDPTSSAV